MKAALGGEDAEEWIEVTVDDLRAGLRSLSTVTGAGVAGPGAGEGDGLPIDVVALGSPHFSPREFAELLPLVERHPPAGSVEFVVCTNRLSLDELERRGSLERLRAQGVRVVVDTCVVVAPILRTPPGGVLMTNSGKFAHYAPGNVGFDVVFGSLAECVRSAHAGRLWRDPELWP